MDLERLQQRGLSWRKDKLHPTLTQQYPTVYHAQQNKQQQAPQPMSPTSKKVHEQPHNTSPQSQTPILAKTKAPALQEGCVGLGYGLYARVISWNTFAARTLHEVLTTHSIRHHSQAGEYQPHSHRLRLSPSPQGPANPARIDLAQEPLDLRRECFSHSLSLLMSAFSLPIPPAPLTGTPSQAYGTLRYHALRRPQLRQVAQAPVHLRRRTAYLDQ
eukprot:TRINITY_DN691_c1_g1_i11.p2 TRINITY_DN691_c1_g1~~TRINITY_DN691_c1_g1_i11.p2  ORF type:complete len:216 (-),score=-13.99 TRINITY_DN691_c1_g1_i11:178-825(-)